MVTVIETEYRRRIEFDDDDMLTIINLDNGVRVRAALDDADRRTLRDALGATLDGPADGPWTRDDVPDRETINAPFVGTPFVHDEAWEVAADFLAEWLNAHHPKANIAAPAMPHNGPISDIGRETLESLAKIAYTERDQAERERDEWEGKFLDADKALHDIRRERDEAVRRAERMVHEIESHSDAARRAQNALIGTAPAVTRDEVEKVVQYAFTRYGAVGGQARATDAVCALFGVEAEQTVDPIEAKAKELWEVAYRPQYGTFDGEQFMVRESFLRIAANVLGQETDQ